MVWDGLESPEKAVEDSPFLTVVMGMKRHSLRLAVVTLFTACAAFSVGCYPASYYNSPGYAQNQDSKGYDVPREAAPAPRYYQSYGVYMGPAYYPPYPYYPGYYGPRYYGPRYYGGYGSRYYGGYGPRYHGGYGPRYHGHYGGRSGGGSRHTSRH